MTQPEHGPRGPAAEVDLHGLSPAEALRRLARELHTARVRGALEVLVITGRGWGNRLQEPILRQKVESWLSSSEGRRAGVVGTRRSRDGGALHVELRR